MPYITLSVLTFSFSLDTSRATLVSPLLPISIEQKLFSPAHSPEEIIIHIIDDFIMIDYSGSSSGPYNGERLFNN